MDTGIARLGLIGYAKLGASHPSRDRTAPFASEVRNPLSSIFPLIVSRHVMWVKNPADLRGDLEFGLRR